MSSDHGFEDGDVITYQKGSNANGAGGILGMQDGMSYVVRDATDTTFTLRTLGDTDGTATFTYGATTTNNSTAAGTGAKFHLSSLAGAPSVGLVGTDPVESDVSSTENLKIYGYVGDETITFKSSATAKDIVDWNAFAGVKNAIEYSVSIGEATYGGVTTMTHCEAKEKGY